MNEVIEELKKLVRRVRDLEQSYLKIKSLVFGTGEGRFAPPKYAGDPASPTEGDVWYNTTTHKLRVKINGSSVDLH